MPIPCIPYVSNIREGIRNRSEPSFYFAFYLDFIAYTETKYKEKETDFESMWCEKRYLTPPSDFFEWAQKMRTTFGQSSL